MNFRKIITAFLIISILILPSCRATNSGSDQETEKASYTEAQIEEININTGFIKRNYEDYYDDLINNTDINKEMYNDLVNAVNKYRSDNGVASVSLNSDLTTIAMIRAEEVAGGTHSHQRPNGHYFSSLHKEYGWDEGKISENIGWGYNSVDEVMRAWETSQSHNTNMLNSSWVCIGVGIVKADDGTYAFVQEFAEKSLSIQ